MHFRHNLKLKSRIRRGALPIKRATTRSASQGTVRLLLGLRSATTGNLLLHDHARTPSLQRGTQLQPVIDQRHGP